MRLGGQHGEESEQEEVEVEIDNCGLCHTDLSVLNGDFGLPFDLGGGNGDRTDRGNRGDGGDRQDGGDTGFGDDN